MISFSVYPICCWNFVFENVVEVFIELYNYTVCTTPVVAVNDKWHDWELVMGDSVHITVCDSVYSTVCAGVHSTVCDSVHSTVCDSVHSTGKKT